MGKVTQKINDKIKLPREFSSGGVVFKKDSPETFFLVCKSMPSHDYPGEYWRLPKGWIDDGDGGLSPGPISSGEKRASEKDLQITAEREVREEGGVNAEIIKKIVTTKYFTRSTRGRVMKFVTFYLMEWKSDLSEGFGFETEQTLWLNFKDAVEKLNNVNEKKVLEKAFEILKQSEKSN